MLGDSACITHFCKCGDGGLYKVVGVGRTLRLGKDIVNADAFEHGAHSTTGYNSGTFGSGEKQHLCSTIASSLLVGNGALDYGNLNEVFLGSFHAFGNGSGYFTGFTETVTDHSLSVSHYHNGSERKGATTLSYLCHTIDSNESIFQFFIVCVYSVCHNP